MTIKHDRKSISQRAFCSYPVIFTIEYGELGFENNLSLISHISQELANSI